MRRLGAATWTCLALAACLPSARASVGDRVEELRRVNIPFEQTYRRRVALCLGVNEYAAFPSLEYAVADAQSVGSLLRAYGFDEVLVWTNGDVSKDGVVNELLRLKSEAAEDDLFVFYFAGHGQTVPLPDGGERGFLIPPACDPAKVAEQGISMGILKDIADMMPNRHTLFLVDACYSGYGLSRSARGMSVQPAADSAGELKEYVATMLSKKSAQVLVAGGKQDQAQEAAGHGMFTRTVLECLSGKTPEAADGLVEASELSNYVRQQVKVESKGRQTPQYGWLYGEGDVLFVTGREQRQAAEPVRPVVPASLAEAVAQARQFQDSGRETEAYRRLSSAFENTGGALPTDDSDRLDALRALIQLCLRLEKFDLARHYSGLLPLPATATLEGTAPLAAADHEALRSLPGVMRTTLSSGGLAVTVTYDRAKLALKNIEAHLRSSGHAWTLAPGKMELRPAAGPAKVPESWPAAWPTVADRARAEYTSWARLLGLSGVAAVEEDFQTAVSTTALERLRQGWAMDTDSSAQGVVFATPLKTFWQETLAAANELSRWPRAPLKIYQEAIASVLEPGAIYFGGTDPGRYLIAALNDVQAVPPWFVLSQNAVADARYLNAFRLRYGDRIWLPSAQDSIGAFENYVLDVQAGRIAAGAEVTFDKGRVTVAGTAGIMEINGYLTKAIFEANKDDHPIYVEESYAIPWMVLHLLPRGPIMQLHREPAPVIPQSVVAADADYWANLTAQLLADPTFTASTTARAAFSKLRSASAGLYVFRRQFAAAEASFRQAIELYPLSPEANFRLADVYMQQFRFEEAGRVVEALLRLDPNPKTSDFLGQIRALDVKNRRRLELEALLARGGDLQSAVELLTLYASMNLATLFDGLAGNLLKMNLPAAQRESIAAVCRQTGKTEWTARFAAPR